MEHTEMELKLQFLEPSRWEALFASPVITASADPLSFKQETLEAQYYDTPDRRLQEARLAFRIRREGMDWVATVKDGGKNVGGLHERGEWNIPLTLPQAHVSVFADTPIGSLLAETVGDAELAPMFGTHFQRQSINLHLADGSIVELAADRGEIRAGGEKSPILEIELELKSGSPAALLTVGADLAKAFPLVPEWRSKYFRALQLAGLANKEETASPAESRLTGEEPAGTALTGLLIAGIQALLAAQENFIKLPNDPGAGQQFWVTLWQLRSLLAFCEPLVPGEVYGEYQQILMAWTELLEPLADMDALMAAWQEVLASDALNLAVNPVLGTLLSEKRRQTAQLLHDQLKLGQTTPGLLSLWGWLTDNQLLQLPSAAGKAATMAPPAVANFARQQIHDWLDRLYYAGEKIGVRDAGGICLLYLQVTKICRVMEALPLSWSKQLKKIQQCLNQLQNSLAYLQDMQIIGELLEGLLRAHSSRLIYRDAGLLTGWQVQKAEHVCKIVNKRWKKLRKSVTKLQIKKKAP